MWRRRQTGERHDRGRRPGNDAGVVTVAGVCSFFFFFGPQRQGELRRVVAGHHPLGGGPERGPGRRWGPAAATTPGRARRCDPDSGPACSRHNRVATRHHGGQCDQPLTAPPPRRAGDQLRQRVINAGKGGHCGGSDVDRHGDDLKGVDPAQPARGIQPPPDVQRERARRFFARDQPSPHRPIANSDKKRRVAADHGALRMWAAAC